MQTKPEQALLLLTLHAAPHKQYAHHHETKASAYVQGCSAQRELLFRAHQQGALASIQELDAPQGRKPAAHAQPGWSLHAIEAHVATCPTSDATRRMRTPCTRPLVHPAARPPSPS